MGTVVVVVPPTEPGVFLQLWGRGNPKDPLPGLGSIIQHPPANRPSFTNVLTPQLKGACANAIAWAYALVEQKSMNARRPLCV